MFSNKISLGTGVIKFEGFITNDEKFSAISKRFIRFS